MDINSFGSAAALSGAQAGSASKSSSLSLTQLKAQQSAQLLSLLPSPVSSPGLGLNLDIYAAVNSQSLGMLSGGLTALEIANISLGIDMKAPASDAQSADTATAGSAGTVSAPAATGTAPAHGNAPLSSILKADSFVAPEKDPYVVQKDFFGVGGSLNSLA